MADRFALGIYGEVKEELTVTDILNNDQGRPPLPEEVDRSMRKLSHGPITAGPDMETTGVTGFLGACTMHC